MKLRSDCEDSLPKLENMKLATVLCIAGGEEVRSDSIHHQD